MAHHALGLCLSPGGTGAPHGHSPWGRGDRGAGTAVAAPSSGHCPGTAPVHRTWGGGTPVVGHPRLKGAVTLPGASVAGWALPAVYTVHQMPLPGVLELLPVCPSPLPAGPMSMVWPSGSGFLPCWVCVSLHYALRDSAELPPPTPGGGTHTAMLARSFCTSLDFLISSLQSVSSFVQKGWLQGAGEQGVSLDSDPLALQQAQQGTEFTCLMSLTGAALERLTLSDDCLCVRGPSQCGQPLGGPPACHQAHLGS